MEKVWESMLPRHEHGKHPSRIIMSKDKETTFPLRLTQAQRRSVAELLAHLKPQLLLDCCNQRTLQFTLEEIKNKLTMRQMLNIKGQIMDFENILSRLISARHMAEASRTIIPK